VLLDRRIDAVLIFQNHVPDDPLFPLGRDGDALMRDLRCGEGREGGGAEQENVSQRRAFSVGRLSIDTRLRRLHTPILK